MKDKLIEKYKEYIELLGKEIDGLAPLAYTHGWRSSRYEQGKKLREEIALLEQQDETEEQNAYVDLICDKIINYDGNGKFNSEKLQKIANVYYNDLHRGRCHDVEEFYKDDEQSISQESNLRQQTEKSADNLTAEEILNGYYVLLNPEDSKPIIEAMQEYASQEVEKAKKDLIEKIKQEAMNYIKDVNDFIEFFEWLKSL